jgi:hypothetical protein
MIFSVTPSPLSNFRTFPSDVHLVVLTPHPPLSPPHPPLSPHGTYSPSSSIPSPSSSIPSWYLLPILLYPLLPSTTNLLSFCIDFSILDTSYEWNHLLWLFSFFNIMFLRFILHSFCCQRMFYCIFYHIFLLVHQLMDIWVLSFIAFVDSVMMNIYVQAFVRT